MLAGSPRHSTPTRGKYMTDWIEPTITPPSPPDTQWQSTVPRPHIASTPGAGIDLTRAPAIRPLSDKGSSTYPYGPRLPPSRQRRGAMGDASGTDLLFRPPQSSLSRSSIADHQPVLEGVHWHRSAGPTAVWFGAVSGGRSGHSVRLAQPRTTDGPEPPGTSAPEERPLNSAD